MEGGPGHYSNMLSSYACQSIVDLVENGIFPQVPTQDDISRLLTFTSVSPFRSHAAEQHVVPSQLPQ